MATLLNTRLQKLIKFSSSPSINTPTIPSQVDEQQILGNSITNFLTVYFDFSCFLFCSPFRFVRNQQSGWFLIRKRLPQQVFCALFNFLGFFITFSDFRKTLSSLLFHASDQSPVSYFEILSVFSSMLLQFWTLKRFWFNQNEFLAVINFIKTHENFFGTGNLWVILINYNQLSC